MVNGLTLKTQETMAADRAIPASDGESYVIGKDGYMLTKLPSQVEQSQADDTLSQILLLCLTGMIYHLIYRKDGVVVEKKCLVHQARV